eukprot:gene4013-4264_t
MEAVVPSFAVPFIMVPFPMVAWPEWNVEVGIVCAQQVPVMTTMMPSMMIPSMMIPSMMATIEAMVSSIVVRPFPMVPPSRPAWNNWAKGANLGVPRWQDGDVKIGVICCQ